MPTFRYKALKPSGEVLVGSIEAASKAAAAAALQAGELAPIRIAAAHRGLAGLSLRLQPGRRNAMRPKDLLDLARQLSSLLRAGVTLDRALRMVAQVGDAPALREMATAIHDRVRKGAGLADAVAALPAVPRYVAGLLKAGESSGSIPDTLDRIAAHLQQSTRLADELRSALYYPAFVILVAIATLLMMLVVVIPQFRSMFDAGAAPPLELAILFAVSAFLIDWGWFLLAGAVLLGLLLRRLAATAAWRVRLDRLARRLPLAGPLIDRIEGGRFCRTLGILQAGGMPMLQGLAIAGAALANGDLRRRFDDVVPRVRRGEPVSLAIEEAGLLAPPGPQLLRIGEESGQLDRMLLSMAETYDGEVKQRLARLEAVLVPVLTIGIGLFVGVIVAIMLSAVLSSYDLVAS
jgi:general secretion pathway protein F